MRRERKGEGEGELLDVGGTVLLGRKGEKSGEEEEGRRN